MVLAHKYHTQYCTLNTNRVANINTRCYIKIIFLNLWIKIETNEEPRIPFISSLQCHNQHQEFTFWCITSDFF